MIILYKGARGKGKTLTMVKDAYNFYKRGFKIIRNIDLSFGDYLTNEDILKIDKNSEIKNAVIVIDEIQIFFDSRRSMRKENLNFSNFIQQIRKRNITILCTTQYSNTIDLRLRQHLDIVAYPNYLKKYQLCEVVYIDLTTLEDDLFNIGIEPKFKKIIYNPKPFFNMYKTEQMIK